MSRRDVRKGILRSAMRSFVTAAFMVMLAWVPAQAQTGTVTGTVRNATNAQPIAGARVRIPARTMAPLATNVGRIFLPTVPAGPTPVRCKTSATAPDSAPLPLLRLPRYLLLSLLLSPSP